MRPIFVRNIIGPVCGRLRAFLFLWYDIGIDLMGVLREMRSERVIDRYKHGVVV